MKNKLLKENIKLILIITIMITVSLSATYAYIQFSASSNSATGTASCANVIYSSIATGFVDELITAVLDDDYATDTDDSTTEATFIDQLKNLDLDGNPVTTDDRIPYTEISLKRNSDNCYQKARIYINLTEPETNAAPIEEYEALKYAILNPDGTLLTKGIISEFATQQDLTGVDLDLPLSTETADIYTLYLWIDKNISQGYFDGKGINGSIYAKATQSSTIE